MAAGAIVLAVGWLVACAGARSGGQDGAAPRVSVYSTRIAASGYASVDIRAYASRLPGPQSAAPGSLPRITLVRTGGLAGVWQMLTVEPDGAWTLFVRGGATGERTLPHSGRLTATERAELTNLVWQPGLFIEARRTPDPTTCAVGFAHTLVVGAQTVAWDGCGSADQPTAVKIVSLLAAATPL